ncbi:MAG: serine hydrolase [Ruminococcus sp.]|nr:serine hydrolase [Ruminococcus sp.]
MEPYSRLLKAVSDERLDLYGIEVLREGRLLFREMLSPDVRYPAYSATKTVTASAVGLACDEGRFDIGRPLADYLPAEELSALPEENRAFLTLPVSRFLTMTVAGFPFRPEGENWLRGVLSADVDFSAPPKFHYTNVQAYLVGIACENAVGQPLMEYLAPRFWEPLGIPMPEHQTDPQGRFYGATGLKLTVHELSLIGQVYLQGGRLDGRQILPEKWTAEASSAHVPSTEGGYGYFIWTGDNDFKISGKWGQKCLCLPKKQLMVTYMGHMPEQADRMLTLAEELCREL